MKTPQQLTIHVEQVKVRQIDCLFTQPPPYSWFWTDEMMYDIIALELQDSPKRKQQQITDMKKQRYIQLLLTIVLWKKQKIAV